MGVRSERSNARAFPVFKRGWGTYLLVTACVLLLSGCVITAVLPSLGWIAMGLAAALAVAACTSGGGDGAGGWAAVCAQAGRAARRTGCLREG